MPIHRSISRIVTPGPAVAGCQKVGHTFIEVIPADDFIDADPFIRLTDDRLAYGNKEIGAPHPHAGFEALGLVLEGAIRNRENGAVLNAHFDVGDRYRHMIFRRGATLAGNAAVQPDFDARSAPLRISAPALRAYTKVRSAGSIVRTTTEARSYPSPHAKTLFASSLLPDNLNAIPS